MKGTIVTEFARNNKLRIAISIVMVITLWVGTTGIMGAYFQRAGIQPNNTTNDNFAPASPEDCVGGASGNLLTQVLTTTGTSNTPVFQVTTSNSGTNSHFYTCTFRVDSRTPATAGKLIYGATLYYGVQQNNLASQSAPSCQTITFPNSAASETPSTVTPVALPSPTPIPVPASANLNTTTAGAFYSTTVRLQTPFAVNNPQQQLSCTWTFAFGATSSGTTNTPGVTWLFSNNF